MIFNVIYRPLHLYVVDVVLQNIEKMKEQLGELGCVFDWDRELATCDPAYYRWTQWIFLRMYQEGLVYQKVGFG